jgi:hypothetical protein
MNSKRNRHAVGIAFPQTTNRVLVQEYGQRGLKGVSGVVTQEGGNQRYVDTTEARRLVEAGTVFYMKDLHGKVIEENPVEAKEVKTAEEFLDLLTKEEEKNLLDALASNHRFTERLDPSE